MSIKIDVNKCVSCKRCINVCPGSLIEENESGKAFIKYPKDCWGCTACLKECKFKAIKYFLGADIGGNGSYMYVSQEDEEILNWHMVSPSEEETIIRTSRKESNKY